MDDVTWAALTLTLTLLGGIWTWIAFRRRGVASGLRAAAFTLLPAAAWLTHTLRMFTRIVEAVADWATHLVFDPLVWAGVVLAAISAGLFALSGVLRARELERGTGGRRTGRVKRSERTPLPGSPAAGGSKGAPAIDDDMAEIEALLRKRGIS